MSFGIALTGHRPAKLAGYRMDDPFYRRLQDRLEDGIERAVAVHGSVVCHSGLALGADTVWSRAIIAVRERHPGNLQFVAHLPTRSQASVWPSQADVDFWRYQVAVADRVVVYGETYTYRIMQVRNEGMIDAADLLVAVWDGTPGGTRNAITYARGKCRVLVLDPAQFRSPRTSRA